MATLSTYRDAVFEARLAPRLPVVARSLRDVLAAVTPVPFERAPEMLVGLGGRSPAPPSVPPSTRVPVEPGDGEPQVALADAAPHELAANGTGLVWLDAFPGTPMPDVVEGVTVRAYRLPTRALVQVTNLGLTVRTLSRGLVVLVTALDTGEPIPGASVSASDGTRILWRGTTDGRGLARTDDGTAQDGTARVVLVEHQGDHAFAEPGYRGSLGRLHDDSGRRPLRRRLHRSRRLPAGRRAVGESDPADAIGDGVRAARRGIDRDADARSRRGAPAIRRGRGRPAGRSRVDHPDRGRRRVKQSARAESAPRCCRAAGAGSLVSPGRDLGRLLGEEDCDRWSSRPAPR